MKINEKELKKKARDFIESGEAEDRKIRELLERAMQESLDKRQ